MSSELDTVFKAQDVSRETLDKLQIFSGLLRKWNPKINLVSRSSLDDHWNRHILDSVQVFRLAHVADHWVDLGSGGGFPGLICAIMAQETHPETRCTLVESDQRKSAFLRTAARECGIRCDVVSRRIESVPPLQAGTLTARALADLSVLLSFCDRHLDKNGTALFPKGASWKKEVADAAKEWNFEVDPITSITEPQAVILKIKGVSRG